MAFYSDVDAFKEIARLWATDRQHAMHDALASDRRHALSRMSALIDAGAAVMMEREERETHSRVKLPSPELVQANFVDIVGPPPLRRPPLTLEGPSYSTSAQSEPPTLTGRRRRRRT